MDVRPYDGYGPLRFGMTAAEVSASLGRDPDRRFLKTPRSQFPTEAFHALGLHVHYGGQGAEAFEMGPPAEPALDRIALLGRPFRDVRADLSARDDAMAEDEEGLTSQALGIGLYAPTLPDDPAAPVDGVIVFARGYYD